MIGAMKKTILFILIASLCVLMFSCAEGGGGDNPPESNAPEGAIYGEDVDTTIISNYENGSRSENYLLNIYNELAVVGEVFPLVKNDSAEKAEHEIVVGDTSREITAEAKRLLIEKINAEADTLFGEGYDKEDITGYAVYASGGSVAVIWLDFQVEELAIDYFIDGYITENYLVLDEGHFSAEIFSLSAYLDKRGDEIIENAWNELYAQLPTEYRDGIIRELKNLYTLYDERMVVWLANLYDPGVGGWYHSNSARDTEGYLPDVENTYVALSFVADSGMAEMFDDNWVLATPDWILEDIGNWIYSLQDEDGFFYHPQWPKKYIEAIGAQSRITRDRGSAKEVLNRMGKPAKYGAAIPSENGLPSRLEDASAAVAVSKVVGTSALLWQYESVENFREYLDGLEAQLVGASDADKAWKFYSWGNTFQSSTGYVKADPEMRQMLIDFFEKHQSPNTGLWGEKLTYDLANGLHKVGAVYNALGAPLKYMDKIVDSIFEILMYDVKTNPAACVFIYNTWSCIPCIYTNIRNMSGVPLEEREEKCNEIKARVYELAEDAIRVTYDQVKGTQMPDGSYGYNRTGSSYAAQGCHTAVPGSREGDVNGNQIASLAIIHYIMRSLDLPDFEVPLFTEKERAMFFGIIEKLGPVVKKNPKPSHLPDLSKYQ